MSMRITITKNIVERDDALTLSSDYVAAVEGNYDILFDKVLPEFEKLRKGQQVLTYIDGVFVKAKVSSINHNSPLAIDGPIVRVSNGEYSWRVDGDKYAIPI